MRFNTWPVHLSPGRSLRQSTRTDPPILSPHPPPLSSLSLSCQFNVLEVETAKSTSIHPWKPRSIGRQALEMEMTLTSFQRERERKAFMRSRTLLRLDWIWVCSELIQSHRCLLGWPDEKHLQVWFARSEASILIQRSRCLAKRNFWVASRFGKLLVGLALQICGWLGRLHGLSCSAMCF